MSNEYEEFQRAYSGGWGKVPLENKAIKTFRILGFGGLTMNDAPIQIEYIDTRESTIETTIRWSHILRHANWYYPESKYVNTPNFVLRSVAFPQRQWSKVLTNNNGYFSPPGPIRIADEVKPLIQQSVLDALDNYDNPYPSYTEALKSLEEGKAYAKAFAKRFLITMDFEAEYPLLIYKNTIVGYDDGQSVIMPASDSSLKIGGIITKITGRGITYESR